MFFSSDNSAELDPPDAVETFGGRLGLALSRSSDPVESRDAAGMIVAHLPTLQAHALALVRMHPGCTVSELAERFALRDPRRIGRRLSELFAVGIVEKTPKLCTITNRTAAGWVLSERFAATGLPHGIDPLDDDGDPGELKENQDFAQDDPLERDDE